MIIGPGETPRDTTGDDRWVPVMVTARLATPAIGIDHHPLHLDAPLSYGAWQQYLAAHGHGELPPMTDSRAADFRLPLATWTSGGTWGWACSRARYTVDGYTTMAMRRRPATDAMARWSPDAKHHLSAGPMKARDIPLPATLVSEVAWRALADPPRLLALLQRVRSLGRLGRHGHGRILFWTVTDTAGRDGWRDRVLPSPGAPLRGIRAPYHHPSRQVPAC